MITRYLIIIFAVLLCLGNAYYVGWSEGVEATETKWKLVVIEAQAKIAKLEAQGSQTTVEVVTKYVDKVKIVKEKGDVVIKEVPIYITKADDSRCVIPNGFVVLHNAAATNQVPRTP